MLDKLIHTVFYLDSLRVYCGELTRILTVFQCLTHSPDTLVNMGDIDKVLNCLRWLSTKSSSTLPAPRFLSP